MKLKILALAAAVALAGCTNDDDTRLNLGGNNGSPQR